MARRSRSGGGRGRRTDQLAVRYLLWRTVPGKVWVFASACRTYPLFSWFAATFITLWFASGSGATALQVTP